MTDQHPLDKLARLMSSEPADILHPLRLVKSQAVLEGELLISDMQRLSNVVHRVQDTTRYKLKFALDDHGYPCIEEYLEANLILTCQRCLGPVHVALKTESRLAILYSDKDVEDLPAEYEPLVLSEDTLSLRDFIEDELLLALPMAPSHSIEECSVKIVTEEHNTEKHRPFADIKQLQMKNRSNK